MIFIFLSHWCEPFSDFYLFTCRIANINSSQLLKDGTTNFIHCFPFSCVSICLAVSGEPVVGVVHNPILGETFTAIRGGGCYVKKATASEKMDSTFGDVNTDTKWRGVRCSVNKNTTSMSKVQDMFLSCIDMHIIAQPDI